MNKAYRRRALSIEALESRLVLSATLQEAGISQLAINAINNSQYSAQILADQTLQNVLDALVTTQTAPPAAIVLDAVDEFSQITSGTAQNPNVYLIQGDFTITNEISLPDNVTVYVDGSIFKQGNFSGPGGVHSVENTGANADVIFDIYGSDNVQLIGVNNAKLHSNPNLQSGANHATAVYIDGNSSNVLVDGFEITNVWEGVVARFGVSNVTTTNNFIHNTVDRAIWHLGTSDSEIAHNFVANAGVDGIDFDAFNDGSIAYENVVIGAGRWAGFVEEAAHDNFFIRGLSLIVDLGNPNRGYMLGWADNGTTQGIVDNSGQLTRHNYFIDNVVFDPGNISQSGGDYFAKEGAGKGPTYFWANRGYGAGQSQNNFVNAEWLTYVPTAGGRDNAINGVQLLADLDAKYNVATPGDFNNDNYVDNDDLAQWQGDYGLNGDSDADQDGDSDGADFLAWQQNYNPEPPPMDVLVTVLDTDYSSAQGYSSGNLSGQQGWLGQNIAQVDTSGTGTVSSVGGPWDRNMHGTGATGGAGGNPSGNGFNPGDQLRITYDYQFNLSGNVNTSMANVGFRNEGPNAANMWQSAPLEGFHLVFNTTGPATGGIVQVFPDMADSNVADALVLDGVDVGINPASGDFVSDNLQIYYQASTDGAGNWSVDDLVVENLDTASSFTYTGAVQTFTYADSDAFFAQQMAPNADLVFTGVTDGVKFEYFDPATPLAGLAAAQAGEDTNGKPSLLGAAQAWDQRSGGADAESTGPVYQAGVAEVSGTSNLLSPTLESSGTPDAEFSLAGDTEAAEDKDAVDAVFASLDAGPSLI